MKNYFFSFLFLFYAYIVDGQKPVQQIPEFTFYKLDNKPFTKKDVSAQKKAFFVFFDSSCDHCQQAMDKISAQYKKFNNTVLYLVTLDDVSKTTKFMGTFGKNLINKKNVIMLRDLKNEFITDFNPRKYPSMLLFSVTGKLLIYRDDPNTLPEIFKFL